MAMTDEELIAHLREAKITQDLRYTLEDAAADRIEQLVKERDNAEAKLAKAVEALGEISSYDKGPSAGLAFTARILLAELEK